MIKALLKKQFLELFSVFFRGKNGKKVAGGKAALYIFLYVMLILMVVGYSSMFAIGLGATYFASPDTAWAYFGMGAIAAVTIAIVGSVFMTYNSLYLAKDNEFLLSLPIQSWKLLFVRLFGVWFAGFAWESLVLLPFFVIFYAMAPGLVTALGVVFQILLWIGLSFVILFMTAILGWLIAKVATHLGRYKTLVIILLFLAGFAGYMFLVSQLEGGIMALFNDPEAISEGLGGFMPAYAFGKACLGSPLHGIIFFIISIALFALVYWVLTITFNKILMNNNKGKAITSNKRQDKQKSVNSTLIKREFKHYLSNAMYILNSSLGYIFLPIIGVLALVNHDAIQVTIHTMAVDGAGDGVSPDAIEAMIKALLPIAIFFAVGFLAGTSVITAPSVSLEGKKISVLQAFPIHMKQVLWSKIEFHCLIALPFVLSSVIMVGIGLGLEILDVIIVVILSAIMVFFFGVFGLACNLKYPMLNWTNENVALKQSMSVLFCVLVGVLAPIVFALLYFFVFINFLMPSIYLLIIAALFGLVSWLILRWLNTKGAEKFQYLS